MYIKGGHYWLGVAMFRFLLPFQTTTIDGQFFVYAIAYFPITCIYVSTLPNVLDPIIGICSHLFWNCNPTTMIISNTKPSFHACGIDFQSGLRHIFCRFALCLNSLFIWCYRNLIIFMLNYHSYRTLHWLSQSIRVVLIPKTHTILPSLIIN